jgi:hypothetical protein
MCLLLYSAKTILMYSSFSFSLFFPFCSSIPVCTNSTLTHTHTHVVFYWQKMCLRFSDSCGTPPTTPLTPLDELALKRHRFLANLIDAAQSAIANNHVRFDQLESFNFSPCDTSSTNSKSNKILLPFFVTLYFLVSMLFLHAHLIIVNISLLQLPSPYQMIQRSW